MKFKSLADIIDNVQHIEHDNHEVLGKWTAAQNFYHLAAACEAFDGEHPMHPVLGPLTRDEWIGFHLRHCQHHLSFIKLKVGNVVVK